LLRVDNIEVKYSNVIIVLKGVSLKVEPRSVVALLGSNGAGKTTTLKAISGILQAELGEVTDGSIEYNGVKIEQHSPEDIVKMGIVQVVEGRRLFQHLIVEENLKVGAYIRQDRQGIKQDIDMVYSYFPRLKDLKGRISGFLSGGEQQMLVIGSALMGRPSLMCLDEPSLGLAPQMVKEIFGIVKQINTEEKTSILLVEQNVRAALGISDYGYVLENGRIVLDGLAVKLEQNEDIKEFYLGLSEVGKRKSYRDVKHYRRRKRWLS
jgi:branched-chain amino acid transport system ATP-binding protein